ncbi:uncharacterized protein LOC122078054 [Macadamia integrifolia]|uniref:uncharacterized protein LOC122078054 n=1 Tax=Macadamia integrifolia TaxID=60698 RepID=UPI001C4F9A1E|nr:uncharacterized protein LOC122078054 [Macadamia integrifolia]
MESGGELAFCSMLPAGWPPDRGKQKLITDFWPMEMRDDDEGCVEVSSPAHNGNREPLTVASGNSTKVIIPQDTYEDRLGRYRFALIGRINFHHVFLDNVRREAHEAWNLQGAVKMVPMGKGVTIFQFASEGDMVTIWRRSPVKVRGQLVRFQRWHLDFNIHEKPINKVLVWVRFPELPLEYWHEKVLLTMAKAYGRSLALDQRTKNVMYGNCARVLVEMEIGGLRPEEIQVERKQPGTENLFWFKQKLFYEDAMGKCGYCKKVGHIIGDCRKKIVESKAACHVNDGGIPGANYVDEPPRDSVAPTTLSSTRRLQQYNGAGIIHGGGSALCGGGATAHREDENQMENISVMEVDSEKETNLSESITPQSRRPLEMEMNIPLANMKATSNFELESNIPLVNMDSHSKF